MTVPQSRLARPVRLSALAAVLLLTGAATAAQTFSDAVLLGIEIGLGASVQRALEDQFGPAVTLPDDERRWVEAVFRDLVPHLTRRDIRYTVKVIDSPRINAFAAPGGAIYLTTGLLSIRDSDVLANVLAHELAHVERRHGLDNFLRALRLMAQGRTVSDATLQQYIDEYGVEMVLIGWGRAMEHEADALGQQIAAAAGYDPYGLVLFFDVLRLLDPPHPGEVPEYDVHPHLAERAARAWVRALQLPVAERRTPKPAPPPARVVAPAPSGA